MTIGSSTSSTNFDQGDIYWVTLSSGQGSAQSGRRPCVVMSRRLANAAGRTVVIVPLTSKTDKANAYRILLPVSEMIKDVTSQSTLQNSVALCDHVRVIDKAFLETKIGRLSQNAILAVQLGLANIFDIR
jgi:mRNA-degrading endonuclease toxin of MazEF toxin-antitoxin module